MKKGNLIEVKDLIFKYDKKVTLDIKDLEIPANKIIVLLGPSGSGKTTLLNLISHFLKPTKGTIEVLDNPKVYEMGYIMQDKNVYPNVSVFQNVYLSAKNCPSWLKTKRLEAMNKLNNNPETKNTQKLAKITQKYTETKEKYSNYVFNWYYFLASLYNLKNLKSTLKTLSTKEMFKKQWKDVGTRLKIYDLQKKKAAQLSGGQRQRVAFAKAIIKNSKIIILDEPFSALDAKIKENTIRWIATLKNEFNLSMVMVTHDQQDAMKLGDRIILMHEGKIVQNSTPQDLYDEPNNLFVAKFIGYPEINLIDNDSQYNYYIRHNKMHLSLDGELNAEVVSSKHLGDSINYTLKYKSYLINVLDNKLKITNGTKVHVDYDKKDILIFDKEGNRVK